MQTFSLAGSGQHRMPGRKIKTEPSVLRKTGSGNLKVGLS